MKDQGTILIVDDNIENIKVLSKILEVEGYRIRIATDGFRALRSLAAQKVDLVLLDVMMPGLDGYEVLKRIKSNPETMGIPVIFLTAMSQISNEQKGLVLGAIDYITKPLNSELVKTRVRNILLLKAHQDDLENEVKRQTKELRKTQNVIIETLGVMAEYRDVETGEHIQRTGMYVRLLLEYLAKEYEGHKEHYIDKELIKIIVRSAPLHDIGKVAIPDTILLKPGKLTDEEMDIMKGHTLYGARIIGSIINRLEDESFLRYAREIALTHHERWDGGGYPYGRLKDNIPIIGRVMAIADVYDALRTKRVYKDAYTHNKSVEIINDSKGKQFDPVVVNAFLFLQNEFEHISNTLADGS